jgi:predicted negative regulator of RcsB-dependent stress response
MVKALQQVPGEPVLLEHYGDILAALGRKPEAIENYRQALLCGGPLVVLKDKIRANSKNIGKR